MLHKTEIKHSNPITFQRGAEGFHGLSTSPSSNVSYLSRLLADHHVRLLPRLTLFFFFETRTHMHTRKEGRRWGFLSAMAHMHVILTLFSVYLQLLCYDHYRYERQSVVWNTSVCFQKGLYFFFLEFYYFKKRFVNGYICDIDAHPKSIKL